MLLNALPFGQIFLGVYLFIMAVFCASHMDAAAYAVAATSTRNMQEGQDPSPTHRLFWCIALTLIPLAMLFAKVSLSTMETAVVLTAIPFLVILMTKIYGFLTWMFKDYGAMPAYLIEEESVEREQNLDYVAPFENVTPAPGAATKAKAVPAALS